MTHQQAMTHANGSEQTWVRLAARLQAALRPRFPRVEVKHSEATDWSEPGTPRHGLDYWFLVYLEYEGRGPEVDDYLDSLGIPTWGGSEDVKRCGKHWYDHDDTCPDCRPYYVGDILPGQHWQRAARSVRRVELVLARVEKEALRQLRYLSEEIPL